MQSRTGWKRTWIKLYCYEWLHGSISYQLTDEEQSVWAKFLALAGLCGHAGMICDNDGRAYPHSFIAHELHISEELLEHTLDKCKKEGRIKEDKHGIHITNWVAYQSEYQRQKPYREEKKKGKYYDTTVSFIKVGGEELRVMLEQGGDKYYLNDKGEKVYVEFDDESGKYKLRN